ncbi:Acyl carrier protein (fragment) [Candidatus Sulfotelmatobacter kueseliae]|uniref:Acyl carrier protein n=1 Tax=Candidatus Sulfotelmatobacter kueseliae TaxID=2042962 RepID=A0A2U3KKU0_9BACT
MQTTDIERDVREFVIQHFLSGDAGKLRADGSLLGDVIDSMGVITLVAYVQEHFGITVKDDEVLPSNLDTIANLAAFVERKIGA